MPSPFYAKNLHYKLPVLRALAGQVRKEHGYNNRYSTYGRFNYFLRLCWCSNSEQKQRKKKIVSFVQKGSHSLLTIQFNQTAAHYAAANKQSHTDAQTTRARALKRYVF
jgi:hypothetical protein